MTDEERQLVKRALKELRSMQGSRVVAIGTLEYLLDPDPERFWPQSDIVTPTDLAQPSQVASENTGKRSADIGSL